MSNPIVYLEIMNIEEIKGISKKNGKEYQFQKIECLYHNPNGRRVVEITNWADKDGSYPKLELGKKYSPSVSLYVSNKRSLETKITYKEIV